LLSFIPGLSNRKGSEGTRRTVHFLAGGCALLLEPLGWKWGAVLAGAALAYNAVLAPRLGLDRAYRREGEGVWGGLTTYPLAVLLLVLLAPLHVAAGAWAVLASADPVAAAVGSRFPRPHAPMNPRKSIVGTAAGAIAGALACWGVLLHMDVAPAFLRALAAGALGAAAEALPIRGDDNLRVAAVSALALWIA
jgi:dolichol kinase